MNMVRRFLVLGGVVTVLATTSPAYAAGPPSGRLTKCPPDAAIAGSVCMDKYEASVWQVPNPTTTNKALVKKIQNGTATLAKLQAGGATQVALDPTCSPLPDTFPDNGQWTVPLYAVSIPGVHPAECVSWFQAQQACGNSGKRLPSNAEWQLAVAGSPDPGPDNGTTDCNTTGGQFGVVNTGSRSGCVSSWGAYDMVGNKSEWVADWVPSPTVTCSDWGDFSNDWQCFNGASTVPHIPPSALTRGGDSMSGAHAGPLAVMPQLPYNPFVGFRCAR